MDNILSKINDPSIKWYIYEHFGRRVYGNITGTNQTLSICDDMICIPVRFSEYFRWWNRAAGAPGNGMFDGAEAWDHTNETNPTTSYPYDANGYFILGYGGYFIPVELTDGTNKVVVHIVRKYNQLLIQNMGYYISGGTKSTVNIPVKVYFPPASLNLVYTTNGSVASDGITLTNGQYALFYPYNEAPYSIDTTRGIFGASPMGVAKTRDYELYIPSTTRWNVEIPAMYTGIRTAPGRETIPLLLLDGRIASGNRGGINVGGFRWSLVVFGIYDSDPYCSQGTWAEHNIPYTVYIGWAEDENGNVKYILLSALAFKHTTKTELRGEISATHIYDVDNNEVYALGWIRPQVNMYSYGRNAYVCHPSLPLDSCHPIVYYFKWGRPSRVVIVKPDDSIDVKTSPASNQFPYWEWNDGYGGCSVWSDKAFCLEILALYTDDNITINPKDMLVDRNGAFEDPMIIYSIQIKPFMDRPLSAGKTYFAMARAWIDSGGQSNEYYASRIRKYTPRVITASEWNALLTSLPPYTLNLIGAPEANRRYIVFNLNKTQFSPGETITITGSVRNLAGSAGSANRPVHVVLIDASTNTAIASTQVTTDTNGNFTATLQAPSQPGTYKIVVIAR